MVSSIFNTMGLISPIIVKTNPRNLVKKARWDENDGGGGNVYVGTKMDQV